MKTPGKSLRPEQRKYQEFMAAQGFECHVWFKWEVGAVAIARYMNLDRFAPILIP